jgi:hypothetical protein
VTQLGKLTRRIESSIGRLLGTQRGESSEPLELVTDILRDVEQRVEPIGGGRRLLPFTNLAVIVLAPRKEDVDRFAPALGSLDVKIRERLRELACEPPARLDVNVQFVRKPRKNWSEGQRAELLFSRESSGARASRTAALPATRLIVLRGTTAKRTYSLSQAAIRFGRGEHHADSSGRTRQNDIAFLDDGDEVNRTVARAQAHLSFDRDRREFRLFDDGSSNGTRIVRESEIIPVTPQSPRGVRVASGDAIELGRARVRFELV